MLDKQKCDRIKAKIKQLFVKLDVNKLGSVPLEAFKQILSLH